MADLDRRYAQGTTVGRAETGVIDQGLRSHMLRVYNYMAVGLAITGVVAYLTYMFAVVDSGAGLQAHAARQSIFASALHGWSFFAPLGMVFFLSSARINILEPWRPPRSPFWAYATLVGLSLASIFLVYTMTSITRVFFISAASFGATEPLRLHYQA